MTDQSNRPGPDVDPNMFVDGGSPKGPCFCASKKGSCFTIAVAVSVFVAGFLLQSGDENTAWAGEAKEKQEKPDLKIVVIAESNTWNTAAKVAHAVSRRFSSRGVLPAAPTVRTVDQSDPIYQAFRLAGIKGIRAYRNMEFETSIRHLNEAVENLERAILKYGPSVFLIEKMVNAQYYLGACHLGQGDIKAAERAFLIAASYDPTGSPPSRRFSSDVIKAFQNALKSRDENTGMFIIQANESARLFVDGHDYGAVPQTIKDLPLGRHFFLLYRKGYITVARFIDHDSPSGSTWKVNVSVDPDQSEARDLISSLDRELRTKRDGGPAIEKLARSMGAKQLVVCRASLTEAEASWYDVRKRAFIKRVRRPNPVPGEPAADDIAASLFVETPIFDLGTDLTARCLSDNDCPGGRCIGGKCVVDVPFYKKWWFWVAVGAGAAAAAAAGAVVATIPERPILRLGHP